VQTFAPSERDDPISECRFGTHPNTCGGVDVVIAEVVPDIPWLHGDGELPADLVTHFVDGRGTPITYPIHPDASPEHRRMADLATGLIRDGDALQMGVGVTGQIARSLLELLRQRNDLGLRSESTGLGGSASHPKGRECAEVHSVSPRCSRFNDLAGEGREPRHSRR
jgi:hypothetical protein